MRVIFFDTETTGTSERDRLCQLAVKERGSVVPVVNAIYKPPLPISVHAMAVHHITERMAAQRPEFVEAPEYRELKSLFEHPETVAVAHNAAFDLGMLAREDVSPGSVICTYKVATALDTDEQLGGYSLQYLRYRLGLEVEAQAHDAWGDAMVLEAIFEELMRTMLKKHGSEESALREMLAISAKPRLFTTFRFGKYRDKKIEDVARAEPGYLEWLLKEKRKEPYAEADWIYTLEHFLLKV